MPNFRYKAINSSGKAITSEIVAPSERDVIQHLQKLNLIPVEIKQLSTQKSVVKFPRRVKAKDVVLFTKQLYTLIKSGIPILISLNAIKEQTSDSSFKTIIGQLVVEIEQGNSLSAALSQFPKIFPPLYVNSVKVGELSGTLEDTLRYLYRYLEEENKIRQNVKKALRYPLLVIFGLIFAFIIFITMVIPNFIPIFTSSGLELPLPTRLLITIYRLITEYSFYLVFTILSVAFSLFWYSKTNRGRYYLHKFLLDLPILGGLLRKVSISRFAKLFFTMNRTGIPVVQAFETMSENIENEVYRREIQKVLERVKFGESIAGSLRQSLYFSPFIVEMVAIGEKSGSLDEMLESVSNYYDMEVNEMVNNMTSLIEPVVTVILGGMVFILALAIFLPMWDLMSLAQ